jgi:hypothetical protein
MHGAAALALWLGIGAVNLVGWTALAAIAGRRIVNYAGISVQLAATVALGALALTAPLALLYAVGSCLRFFAFFATLLLASLGSGAVVLDLLRRFSDRTVPGSPNTGDAVPEPPAPGD